MSVNEVAGKGREGGANERRNEGRKEQTGDGAEFFFSFLPSPILSVCLSVCRSIRCFVAPVISPATYLFPPPRAHRTLAPTDEMASEHALTNLSLSLSLSPSSLKRGVFPRYTFVDDWTLDMEVRRRRQSRLYSVAWPERVQRQRENSDRA